MITYESIKKNEAIKTYIERADASLKALGYTEHSYAHVGMVAKRAAELLLGLGYEERTVELVRIAAHLHDIGNVVNRVDHSQSGALIAFRILDNIGMDAGEIAEIVTAIGNHDEGTGVPVSPLAAALIIADKSDVRRSRVRNSDLTTFDIHDRVNYSVTESALSLTEGGTAVTLYLTVDTTISSIMDYFEIFLVRMKLCRSAAESLGLKFELVINGQKFLG
ncbi:MAG: HD domain-containing protein [Ruminococcaceae bacterium]|nr:HD domain-containing protein [Oscillospiraceae bacterium]